MTKKHRRTSDVAKAAGCHPNTVRLYEAWGFIPPVSRTSSGYGQFTKAYVNCMTPARLAFRGPWPGRAIRRSVIALVKQAATGDLGGALEAAYAHLAVVHTID